MTGGAHARRAQWLVIACTVALLLAVPIIATKGPDPTLAAMAAPAGPAPQVGGPLAPMPPSAPLDAALPVAPPSRTGLAPAAVVAAEAAGGRTQLAVAVLDRDTGELAVGARGAEPYYTASLSKLVVAVDMLDRRHFEGLPVAGPDLELIRRALGPSDDSAMNTLWTRYDGAGAPRRVSQRLGLTGTSAPRRAGQWGEMSVPAADMVRIWRYVLETMPAADRDLLISAMSAAPARARDGFDQSFGLLSPAVDGPGGPGAVAKQGWMCCFSRQYYLHSAGTVGNDQRFVVALLTRVPRGPGWEAARQDLNRVAAAAVQALR